MQVHQLQYQNVDHLIAWMDERLITDSKQLLVQVYTYSVNSDDIADLLTYLYNKLPLSTLIGCTSNEQILDGQACDRSTVLSFIQFEKTELHSSLFAFIEDTDSHESGRAFAKQLVGEDTKACIVFTDSLSDSEVFIRGFECEAPDVILAGGISGVNEGETALFTKQGLIARGAVGVSLSGKELLVHNAFSLNWKRIGKNFKVTRAEGKRVYSIDDMSVVDLYKKYLGEKISKEIKDKSSQFSQTV